MRIYKRCTLKESTLSTYSFFFFYVQRTRARNINPSLTPIKYSTLQKPRSLNQLPLWKKTLQTLGNNPSTSREKFWDILKKMDACFFTKEHEVLYFLKFSNFKVTNTCHKIRGSETWSIVLRYLWNYKNFKRVTNVNNTHRK